MLSRVPKTNQRTRPTGTWKLHHAHTLHSYNPTMPAHIRKGFPHWSKASASTIFPPRVVGLGAEQGCLICICIAAFALRLYPRHPRSYPSGRGKGRREMSRMPSRMLSGMLSGMLKMTCRNRPCFRTSGATVPQSVLYGHTMCEVTSQARASSVPGPE